MTNDKRSANGAIASSDKMKIHSSFRYSRSWFAMKNAGMVHSSSQLSCDVEEQLAETALDIRAEAAGVWVVLLLLLLDLASATLLHFGWR